MSFDFQVARLECDREALGICHLLCLEQQAIYPLRSRLGLTVGQRFPENSSYLKLQSERVSSKASPNKINKVDDLMPCNYCQKVDALPTCRLVIMKRFPLTAERR